MSFWGRLFGTEEATGKLIDNVSSGLDSLIYTDQEEARDIAKSRSEARSMVIEWLKNTQGQNLSRRIIALSTTFVWLFQYVLAGILNVATVWVGPETGKKLSESAELISQNASDIVPAVMLILGFYFAAPHMGKIAETALARFGQKNDTK